MVLEAQFGEEIGKGIPRIVECLNDSSSYVSSAAVRGLSSLGAHRTCPSVSPLLVSQMMLEAQFREEIGKTIPRIVECLRDSDKDVRMAGAEALSSLGAYRTCPSVSPLLVS